MSKIKLMDESLANKIAAGEVIERCASVVKELVENSIDANATDIKVNLIDSGIKTITVTDNGDGMSYDDALMAFQRHATSKLLSEDDLFFINTLGFRGEALPSIASVSEVDLTTCDKDIGTHIKIKGGKKVIDEKIASKKGTSITVANIFYNTPARLKYLKSEQTELSATVSFIERIALAHSHIAFTLSNNDKTLVKTSGSNDLLKTIHEVYGLNISSKMVEIKNSNNDYEIYGFICKPEILKSNRNHLVTIVNNRVIRNNDLNNFINDAYYTYKPENKYPIVILKIDTDPSLVDVNTHPTKQDIKMSKTNELGDLITKTIKDALYNNLLIPKIEKVSSDELKNTYIEPVQEEIIQEEQTSFDFAVEKETENSVEVNSELKSLELYPVGLALGTYIIAQNEKGIYLIDQHAAQERINYERYLKALKEEEVNTISPLLPITIELSASEFLIIKENTEILNKMGFVFEEFGINTISFKEHPIWLKEGYEEESIRKILDLIIVHNKKFDSVKFNENIAITLACKMSIKANMKISTEEMESLLNDLVLCDNPYNCPHGRPTIIEFTIYELERMFKRVI